MLTKSFLVGLRQCRSAAYINVQRNFGASAVVGQKATDPIQQLFLEKVRAYAQKSKAAGGKLVDASAKTEKDMKDSLDKLARQYGAVGGQDFSQFPTFNFTDPTLEDVGVPDKPTETPAATVAAEKDSAPKAKYDWEY